MRSALTLILQSGGRCSGAASCAGSSSLFGLWQQNLCQEGGREISWVEAAARQRLGGVCLFYPLFFFFFPSCKQQRGSKKERFRGLCLQRSYNTSCFPRHDTVWQNKVFILCTCQLRSAGSEMMKYYRICCCLFPLGTCADLFKVPSAPSKCFIYYSWHLKISEGNVSRHRANIIFFYLLLFTYVLI